MTKIKIFIITIFIIFTFSNNSFSENLNDIIYKDVNLLIAEGYKLHSTQETGTSVIYHLVSDRKRGNHRLITCVYLVKEALTGCFKP